MPWGGPENPGGWHPVQRMFRDGHTETWRATDAQLGWWGPDGHTRRVITTTDPATLPDKAAWYLATNLARPGGPHDNPDAPHEPADLTEVVQIYGIRHWIEQSYNKSRTNSAGPTSKTHREIRERRPAYDAEREPGAALGSKVRAVIDGEAAKAR